MEFRLPEIGEGVYEAEMVRWLVAVGDTVQRGQGLMEILTDKATMEVPAPFTGTIRVLEVQSGDTLKVGDVILSYDPVDSSVASSPAPPAPKPPSRPSSVAGTTANGPMTKSESHCAAEARRVFEEGAAVPARRVASGPVAAPSVRHLARKFGINLNQVRGSGPGGRILLEDVTALIERTKRPRVMPAEMGMLDLGKAGTRIKFQGIRRRIADHMAAATEAIPHYSYVDECDVTELVKLRASLREPLVGRGIKLTYLSFFVKAVALALRDVPIVNSSLDLDNGDIVMHAHRHVGIAVATRAGLVVPVVRDADRRDIYSIAREIDRLTTEARAGNLALEDLRGGTFTVTSIGGIGGLISTPIINHPEAAILGLGKVVKRPVYDEAGHLRPAEIIYLSFTFDHRIIDGAVGAAFGNALISHLKNPAALLLPEN